MKTKRNCRNCYWHNSCGLDNPCEEFDPLDDSDIVAEYEADLHMRAKEYQSYIEEMNGDA